MSSQKEEPDNLKKTDLAYDIHASVQVIGPVQGITTHGHRGTITDINGLVYVTLDNGLHVRGPYTAFRLIK